MYSIRLFVKIILFIYLYGGRQHSRSCTLHVNVLFLCFCLRFPTYVFFFSLLPFVFSREVGSLHLFVSRRLIFLFLLLYMSQKNPHVVLCIVAKFFCVLVVVSGWVLLIICWWYQCSWLRQTLDRCVLLLVVTWSMVKQAMSQFQQLTNLIQYPWYP